MARIPAVQRREELIAAAWRVMASEGVPAATTRRIVAEAGMQLGTFHYCFRSKDELVRELVEREVRAEIEVATAPFAKATDVSAALAAGFASIWQALTADRDRQLVINELTALSLRDPEFSPLPQWRYARYLEVIEALITGLASSAGVRWPVPVPDLSRLVLSVLVGAVDVWLVTGESAAGARGLELFARQLAAQAEPVGTAAVPTARPGASR